jgi:integrase/recombinase XerC
MTKIISPKTEKKLPSFLSEKDMEKLLEEARFEDDLNGKTERLLLQLFYYTGMRLSEVTGLKDSQVAEAAHTLKIWGKGNKERVIPVSAGLMKEIQAYRQERSQAWPGANGHLLVNRKGQPFGPKAVYLIIKKYLSRVTTIQKKSPHVLRHTFATHLTNNGAELNAVKELLGHSSLAATQVYTHNTIEGLKNAYKKAHPKA